MRRIQYLRRIFAAYLTPAKSQLTFWHDTPVANEGMTVDRLGEYYMPFTGKADYAALFDANGVPMLDYHGTIGRQYNPIAIAQYGLGNYNLFVRNSDPERRRKFLRIAEWLRDHLEPNRAGLKMWMHHFDWDYRTRLVAPWYSGLAQGQGVSVLLRAHAVTGDASYLEAANEAMKGFSVDVADGGVAYTDGRGDLWFEEYIVHPDPPTHILNGFMWGSWGVYDHWLATRSEASRQLFERAVVTIARNLPEFDTGYWSLYEQSGTRMKMLASPFYHSLHIAQLDVMHRLTGNSVFADFAERWRSYRNRQINRRRALLYKSVFKLFYY